MPRMRILTNDGIEVVEVDRFEASLVGSHWNDIRRFLGTGDTAVLDPYRGLLIDGFELATDPDLIEDFDDEGQLDFRDIYDT